MFGEEQARIVASTFNLALGVERGVTCTKNTIETATVNQEVAEDVWKMQVSQQVTMIFVVKDKARRKSPHPLV
jgi:hypothetical protein